MKHGLLYASAIATAMTAFAAPSAIAQDDEAELTQDAITITSRKREETVLETPIAVSAFSADTLEAFGAISARDIADLTPGLQINGDFGRSGERPVIRGISNIQAETPQPVGLFIDGVYVRSGVISSILDSVERVEVLKGPQGALYGRSTYGGVINYITEKPGDELGGEIMVSAAEHDQYEVSGNISFPIGDVGGFMIGGRHYEYGGEYDNVNANTAGARDVGSEETDAFYALLHLTPSDRMEINLRGYRTEDRDGQFAGQLFDSTFNNSAAAGGTACPQVLPTRSYFCGEVEVPDQVDITTSIAAGTDLTPPGLNFFVPPTIAGWDFHAGLDRSLTRITGDFSYDLTDNITFLYQGGYTEEETRSVVNQSYSPTTVSNPFAFPPFSLGNFASVWVTDDINDRSYWSHEVRLNGQVGDRFDWLFGAFAYGDEFENTDRNLSETDYDFGGASTNDEIAIFAAADFAVTDQFSLGAEGRYYEEDVSTDLTSDGETGEDLATTFDGFTWRVTADYQFNNGWLLYGNVATGTKAGGFNTAVNPDNPDEAPFLTFDEEEAEQYEIGLKGEFMDGRGRFTAAIYAIDLTNQQLSQVVIFNEGTADQVQTTVVLNVGETEIRGFEADFNFDVTDSLTVGAAWSTADSEITAGTDETHGDIIGPPNGSTTAPRGDTSLVGFKVPRVSEHSATVLAQYTFPTIGGWVPEARIDGIYASSRYAQVHNLQETGDSFRTNLRISFDNEDKGFSAELWGRNIFDDDAAANVFRYVDPGDFRFFARAHVVFLPRGQQFGATLRKKF